MEDPKSEESSLDETVLERPRILGGGEQLSSKTRRYQPDDKVIDLKKRQRLLDKEREELVSGLEHTIITSMHQLRDVKGIKHVQEVTDKALEIVF